jgi:hypothetical protein
VSLLPVFTQKGVEPKRMQVFCALFYQITTTKLALLAASENCAQMAVERGF